MSSSLLLQGVSTNEKITFLTKHPQTQLGYPQPQAIHSITVCCNFEIVFCLPPDEKVILKVCPKFLVLISHFSEEGNEQ